MTHRTLMEGKALFIFILAAALAEGYAGEEAPSAQEVSESRRYYDSITWHDVVSSGPNRVGYSMVIVQYEPSGESPASGRSKSLH